MCVFVHHTQLNITHTYRKLLLLILTGSFLLLTRIELSGSGSSSGLGRRRDPPVDLNLSFM